MFEQNLPKVWWGVWCDSIVCHHHSSQSLPNVSDSCLFFSYISELCVLYVSAENRNNHHMNVILTSPTTAAHRKMSHREASCLFYHCISRPTELWPGRHTLLLFTLFLFHIYAPTTSLWLLGVKHFCLICSWDTRSLRYLDAEHHRGVAYSTGHPRESH